jgi:two-component system, sensor histidine kinase
VRTDPVLMERIVRNLVSNAVRYTDRGRVVVGCRRHNGLRIEVWDTGRGIPFEEQQHVFQEFYQLGNAERDRAKGLGLGLAIVDRLAKLLDCPLTLRSRPGKGSAFRIGVPLADKQLLTAADASHAPKRAMPHGLILVIDDDTVIQRAMQSLLLSWGHEVIVAGSGAEMLERIAMSLVRPDLIICDYRLRDGENGIAVIERLQSEYNEDIPAVLITGDTAPDRLKEAQESGLILLHKPVTNSKLRAAVGNLVMARRFDEAQASGATAGIEA